MSQPILLTKEQSGVLYCVATPIGNLKDITFRAIETLQNVDLILAEDTRHSGKLLNHYNISTPMKPLHDHNERKMSERIIESLLSGQSMALISDAGTPLVSDPGFVLVRECVQAGVNIISIPGPCAAIAALTGAALPMNHFTFIGFIPAKGQARTQALEDLQNRTETLVFYESGRRLENLMQQIIDLYAADRQVVLAHELTKTYEHYYRGTAEKLLLELQNNQISIKGEWVVCVAGCDANAADVGDAALSEIITKLLPNYSVKDIVDIVVKLTGKKKKQIYQLALSLKEGFMH